jgi:serine/threonine protein kinase
MNSGDSQVELEVHGRSDRDPFDRLVEEFVARHRGGDRPSPTEYCERYPQWADRIRDLFPALLVMERLKPEPTNSSASPGERTPNEGSRLERLGDYRLLREIGRGGMGVVYEAEQESLGRHVALKVLPSHALGDPRHLVRFRREAKAAARLHHSNIVPVFGIGEADGLHYYVMQYIPGQGLDQVLEELRRLRRPRSSLEEARPSPTVDLRSLARPRSGPSCRSASRKSSTRWTRSTVKC